MKNFKSNLKEDTANKCKLFNATKKDRYNGDNNMRLHKAVICTDKKPFFMFLLEDGKDEQRLADTTDVNAFVYSSYKHLQNEHTKAF